MAERGSRSFGGFLRAAGKLAAGRQLSALIFVGAVVALPLLAPRTWVTDFVWAYFSMLTLTSVLGLGFERLAGTLVAEHESAHSDGGVAPIGSLVVVRLATTPIVALAQWAFLSFVGVSLSPLAWCATLAWTLAALLGPVAFGALRVTGDSSTEPAVVLATRVGQFVALVVTAAAGVSVAGSLVVVAGCEAIGVGIAFRAVGRDRMRGASFADVARLPWRRAAALASVEIVALAYLRADLLLVGRILGPALGATYGLLYRVIDGLNGTVGSAGLWLYAEIQNDQTGVENAAALRTRSLALLPRLAIGVGLVMIVGSQFLGEIAPRLGDETRTLQLLIAAFPLLAVNTIELHVWSARGRNREVVRIGLVALLVNVPACLILVPMLGLRGAAIALIASEFVQSALLARGESSAERPLLVQAMAVAVAGALVLLLTGAVLQGTTAEIAVVGAAAVVLVLVGSLYRRAARIVVS